MRSVAKKSREAAWLDLQFAIHELLPSAKSACEYMSRLIEVHVDSIPDADWSPFYKIEYDREIPRLRYVWFPALICDSPPAKLPIAGLWFGLNHPCAETADFYVSGTLEFQLDGRGDWASVPAYMPDRWADSRVLTEIYRLAMAGERAKHCTHEFLCVGYVAYAIKEMLADGPWERIVSTDRETVGVGVGWDAGDPFYIGHVTHEGFQVRPPAEGIAGIRKRHDEFQRRFRERYGRARLFHN